MDEEPRLQCKFCEEATWWAMLVIAVIAVPLIGSIIAMTLTHSSLGQVVIFMLSCWACTWIGMKVMHQSKK